MMALGPKIGRDLAHALVLGLSREAHTRQVPFRDVVSGDPRVARHLSRARLAAALDYRNSLGLAGHFVDKVLTAHARQRPRAKGGRG
jgi:adenylosuccinate lyase